MKINQSEQVVVDVHVTQLLGHCMQESLSAANE